MERYTVGFSLLQRKWATLSLNQELIVKPFSFEARKTVECLTNVTLEVDFLQKKVTTTEAYDSDAMAKEFLFQFPSLALTVGQSLVFSFGDKKLLGLVVRSLDAVDIQAYQSNADKCDVKKTNFGRLLGNTTVTFEKAENSALNLTGKAKGKIVRQSIINPDWDFGKMGIGGLDKEFNAIFRRAFASRVFPPEVVEQLGCKHVKGILLYGPPGTGKSLEIAINRIVFSRK